MGIIDLVSNVPTNKQRFAWTYSGVTYKNLSVVDNYINRLRHTTEQLREAVRYNVAV